MSDESDESFSPDMLRPGGLRGDHAARGLRSCHPLDALFRRLASAPSRTMSAACSGVRSSSRPISRARHVPLGVRPPSPRPAPTAAYRGSTRPGSRRRRRQLRLPARRPAQLPADRPPQRPAPHRRPPDGEPVTITAGTLTTLAPIGWRARLRGEISGATPLRGRPSQGGRPRAFWRARLAACTSTSGHSANLIAGAC